MTYGTRVFKNGKKRGYLIFSTGKRIVLNDKEVRDFEAKVEYWQSTSREITRYELQGGKS
jgi:hypothetical protein